MFKKLAHPITLFVLIAIGYTVYLVFQVRGTLLSSKEDTDRIRHIVASEELILQLNAQLKKISHGIENLRLPDPRARTIFADAVDVSDIGEFKKEPEQLTTSLQLKTRHLPPSTRAETAAKNLQLWSPLLDEIAYFETAKFYFIRGEFTDDALTEFHTDVGFKGLAKLSNGDWAGIKAKQKLAWRNDQTDEWRITAWETKSLKTVESPQFLFTEVLDAALPDSHQLDAARNSEHEAAVNEFYANGGALPWRYFAPISANQRPGISVADVDRDGLDDIYVMVRRGPNQFFRNLGDGTFREEARQWGLDVENFNSCGIFADFDNDGDLDLMLGRSIERSKYLENNGSKFVEKASTGDDSSFPFLVVSMSATDYNGDGLLDVYFSTYRPAVLESLVSDDSANEDQEKSSEDGGAIGSIADDSKQWTDEFLSKDQATLYEQRVAEAKEDGDMFSKILDQVGPPNILMVNRGNGRFEIASESQQLAVWRNTLQATWADFDDDGDPDLYVANDWAADNLFLNNGPSGFSDVTETLGITEFGFAMGVSWGDFDRNGFQDIYVSNMYSKAGRRITSQIAELDPSYNRSVNGNYLYKGSSEGFELASGLEPPALTVAEAGWSWGGQFLDFDNDGFLDIYVLSGYFTAPQEFSSDVDL